MIAPLFADISAYQGVIDWKAYHNWAKQWTGTSMVSMKSSEGIGFTDPRFVANRTGALSAGVDAIIYYHYGRPDLGNAPNLEADWHGRQPTTANCLSSTHPPRLCRHICRIVALRSTRLSWRTGHTARTVAHHAHRRGASTSTCNIPIRPPTSLA